MLNENYVEFDFRMGTALVIFFCFSEWITLPACLPGPPKCKNFNIHRRKKNQLKSCKIRF